MRSIRIGCFWAGLVFVTGCASTRQYVPLPDQSKEIQDVNKARIYVMRPAQFGGGVSMPVSDNGKDIGKTGPAGFLSWERDPGPAAITSKAENTDTLNIDAQKGMVYYLLQEVRLGFVKARTQLELLTADKGKSTLKECHPPKVK